MSKDGSEAEDLHAPAAVTPVDNSAADPRVGEPGPILFLWALLPLLGVLAVDQVTKGWAVGLSQPKTWGALTLVFQPNSGFMLGSLASLSHLYTIVVPATIGALLLFIYAVVQYFLPLRSPILRAGLAIFMGGVLSNIVDRVLRGDVVDFIFIEVGKLATGTFNVADALQWVGVALFLSSYIANGRLLYPTEQRRGRKWIDPKFQRTYCLALIAAGSGFALIAGVLSYTFVRVTVAQISTLTYSLAHAFVGSFLAVYLTATASFLVALFVVGVQLSHRAAGPIRAFERFLDDLMRGEARRLQLRRTDSFRQLEVLADRFHALMRDKLGLSPPPLTAGAPAPQLDLAERNIRGFDPNSVVGRRVWLIFYRYASCPLCAMHLKDVRATITAATAAGAKVLAVYESPASDLESGTGKKVADLLEALGVGVVLDPERRLYNLDRTRRDLWTLWSPRIFASFLRASWHGFRQGAIVGSLGQLPAHFLIDERGYVARAYYGDDPADHLNLDDVRVFLSAPSSELLLQP